jgi:hypothetical protein
MSGIEDLMPSPPEWRLDWAACLDRFSWLRGLAGVPQDPVHHAEGDVIPIAGRGEFSVRPMMQHMEPQAAKQPPMGGCLAAWGDLGLRN